MNLPLTRLVVYSLKKASAGSPLMGEWLIFDEVQDVLQYRVFLFHRGNWPSFLHWSEGEQPESPSGEGRPPGGSARGRGLFGCSRGHFWGSRATAGRQLWLDVRAGTPVSHSRKSCVSGRCWGLEILFHHGARPLALVKGLQMISLSSSHQPVTASFQTYTHGQEF